MKTSQLKYFCASLLLVFAFLSCKRETTMTPPTSLSSAKSILTFTLSGLTPAITATINETAKTINATVPSGTDLTALTPTLTISDKATVSPTSGTAQNFTSSAITYTVTAEDGSKQAYTVTITKAISLVSPTLSYSKTLDSTLINTSTKKSVTPTVEWKSTNGVAGTFSLTGAPTGVTIDATTGVISYANVPWGNYSYSVKATNTDNQSVTVNMNLLSYTYGIRSDKKLEDYEAVATNEGVYTAGASYPDFRSSVFIDVGGGLGTGVLIAENWVLTAGHNFFLPKGSDKPSVDVTKIKIRIGSNPNAGYQEYEVEGVILGPDWVAGDGRFDNGVDIALVKLKSSVNSSVATPAIWNQTVGSETVGNAVWYAGFGAYDEKWPKAGEDFSRKHAYSNILDRAIAISATSGNLAFDFDGGNINTFGDTYIGEDEQKLGTGTSGATQTSFESGTVKGDSGGPLYMYINGQWTVVGVLFGGITDPILKHLDGDYGDVSVFTRVASHKNWINSTMALYSNTVPPAVSKVYKNTQFFRKTPKSTPVYR